MKEAKTDDSGSKYLVLISGLFSCRAILENKLDLRKLSETAANENWNSRAARTPLFEYLIHPTVPQRKSSKQSVSQPQQCKIPFVVPMTKNGRRDIMYQKDNNDIVF